MNEFSQTESKQQILPPNIGSYRYEMNGSTIAQSIHLNITNIMDEVKKQRMDIIKLNTDLRNSKFNIEGQRDFNDPKVKSEIIHVIKTLRNEKTQLLMELQGYREKNIQSNLVLDLEQEIDDLRTENDEYKNQLGVFQEKVQSLQFSLYKLQVTMNEKDQQNEKEHKRKESERETVKKAEHSAREFKKKFEKELEKSKELEIELQEFKDNFEILVTDNERLNERLKKATNEIVSLKRKEEEKNDSNLKKELLIDYNVLDKLRDNLNIVIDHMETTNI